MVTLWDSDGAVGDCWMGDGVGGRLCGF